MAKTSESKLGIAVMQVLAAQHDGEATVQGLIEGIPDYIELTEEDREPSGTRKGEEMWEQRVRNLKSHDKSFGNILSEGLVQRTKRGVYRLTDAGRLHLRNKGLI